MHFSTFLLLFSSLFLSACASLVNIDYDKSVNFKQFKNFGIESKPVRVTQDTRINSPFMKQRVISAIETEMKNKGFAKLTLNPDILIKYHMEIRKELEAQESGVAIGFGTSSGSTAIGFGYGFPTGDISSYDKLVLTIDMVSLKNKLLWRGSLASDLIDGSTPETNNKLVTELVTKILENFPPK